MGRSIRTTRIKRIAGASFLQEIRDDDARLHQLFELLHRLLANRKLSASRGETLSRLPQELHDELATHFSLEEAYGNVNDVVADKQTPRLHTPPFRPKPPAFP
jgi:hypothetical protein